MPFGWMSFAFFLSAASSALKGRDAEIVIHDLSGGLAWAAIWLLALAWDGYWARRARK